MDVPVSFDISVLPEPQRRLWEMLGDTPPGFVLYGGTALALRLGHRQSIDFDFFSHRTFQPDALRRSIPYLQRSRTVQSAENTLTCVVDLDGDVKLSYFGGLDLSSVNDPDEAEGPGILVASLLDLAATKAAVVQSRSSARDYVDLDALLRAGIPLDQALGAASAVYGPGFNPLLTLKALSYYGEGDLDEVPDEVRENLTEAVSGVNLQGLPDYQPREGLGLGEADADCETDFDNGF